MKPGPAQYEQAALGADRDVERLRKVFEATLELPHVASADHPIDCPVCQTAAALGPDRLHQMRRELAAAGDFRRAQTRAREEIDQAIAELARIARSLTSVIPAAATLTEDDYHRRSEQAGGLLSDGKAKLEGLMVPLNEFRERVEAVRESAAEAGDMATAVRTQIIDAKTVDTVGLERGLEDVAEKLASVPPRRESYTVKALPLLDELRAAAVARQQVAGWSELAELAGSPEALLDGLQKRRAHEKSARSLRAAYDDIEAGIGKVLDAKFRSMSSEIARWWRLLRPDEPVEFTKVDRRGSGRRFVLFKALLRPGSGLDGVERDALGVFSDSQLNALGLAAFLARTTKHGDRFVVLDDPVQAGDDEHRATFATGVVEQLLGTGVQVLVVSHEHQLSKLMHNRYDHLPIAGFAVSMAVPGDGAHVVATSDTAEALLQRAAATLSIEDPEYRKINASKLRDAGERVAKEILVKKRTEAGETASIADYEGQTLGPLIAALEPYHEDPSHRGKWNTVNTMLSPGAHDADPPAANELRIASGDLKRFHKDYLKD